LKGPSKRGSPPHLIAVALVLLFSGTAMAENVDPDSDGSQYAWGEHLGWLNAEPQGEGGPGVEVTDTELTGWIWAGDHGWISLSCQNTSSCGVNGYGIANDGKGNLSGRAWGEHLGWISFRTSDGSDCCSVSGTPGCSDPACEPVICAADPYCCYNNWDQICADAAAVEPACSLGCAADPYGVQIHGFTGNFSGFAWTEHDGWINFGTAPAAQSHQIETGWRCSDPDGDGICTASDNCPTWSNRSLETVLFGNDVSSSANKVDLTWPVAVDWQLATGTFTSSADIGTYAIDFYDQGSGTVYSEVGAPSPGFGYWYLFRPDCPAGSYSTGSPFEIGDRDGNLIP
jgi:hypothetical protein